MRTHTFRASSYKWQKAKRTFTICMNVADKLNSVCIPFILSLKVGAKYTHFSVPIFSFNELGHKVEGNLSNIIRLFTYKLNE